MEWLDGLPDEWDERDVGREVWVRARLGWKGLTADEYIDEGVPMLATPDIKTRTINYGGANNITIERYEESPEIKLQEGDVLLTKDGATIGIVNVVRDLPGPATVNGSIAVLTPTGDLDGRFLYWFLVSSYAQATFDRLRGGMGVPHLFQRDINRIKIPYPAPAEQRTIADYLDAETIKVDALVAEQEGLVAVLRERRSAVITSAVTRGIEDVPRTPTGDHYLTDVPAHWRVSRFGREMVVNAGQVDPRTEPWIDMVLVAPNHIESGTGRIVGRETAREQGADSGKYFAREGQVLYSKIRPALNKVAVAVEDCLCSADMYALSSRTPGDARFAKYLMLSQPFHTYATLQSLRVKMPKVNREELGAAPWVVPPAEEQRAIADYLDDRTEGIDHLITEAEGIVAVSKERRAALITAAVTGQIDVRGEVT